MTREEILERVWAQLEPTVYITKADYLAGLEGWEVSGHKVDGTLVCAVFRSGPEIHFTTFGHPWTMTRADVRKYVKPLFDAYGCVKTKTPKDDTRQQRFNRLMGFEVENEDEFFIHYKLTRRTRCLL